MDDLEDAIKCRGEVLSARPPGHPFRAVALNDLAFVIFARFKHLGRIEDLEEAIMHSREVLALQPPSHLNRSTALRNLATVISKRFQQLGRTEDMEEVIRLDSEAENMHHAFAARFGFTYRPGPNRR
jgi:hypothetical protein